MFQSERVAILCFHCSSHDVCYCMLLYVIVLSTYPFGPRLESPPDPRLYVFRDIRQKINVRFVLQHHLGAIYLLR